MSPSTRGAPSVQLVSKPMVPPFRDGSKCLVRDLCLHLEEVTPHVMGTGVEVPELGERAVSHAVYGTSGKFSPALRQNLQAALFLLMKSRTDAWHFVFAPNPRSSKVGATLRRLRKVPTLQTIASPPRSFDAPGDLLFGDIAVAQSAWTRDRFAESMASAGIQKRIELIPPPAPDIAPPSRERCEAERARLGIDKKSPLFVYPGDLEVSQGAARVVEWAAEMQARVPSMRLVVAYRDKTARARERAAELSRNADPAYLTFECNVPDIHALIATSSAVLFPVDDLYGKVDLPIVLLEAMRFGTPVLALDEGPLASLEGSQRLSTDPRAWLEAIERVAEDETLRSGLVAAGRKAVEFDYAPRRIAQSYEALYRDLLFGDSSL